MQVVTIPKEQQDPRVRELASPTLARRKTATAVSTTATTTSARAAAAVNTHLSTVFTVPLALVALRHRLTGVVALSAPLVRTHLPRHRIVHIAHVDSSHRLVHLRVQLVCSRMNTRQLVQALAQLV